MPRQSKPRKKHTALKFSPWESGQYLRGNRTVHVWCGKVVSEKEFSRKIMEIVARIGKEQEYITRWADSLDKSRHPHDFDRFARAHATLDLVETLASLKLVGMP